MRKPERTTNQTWWIAGAATAVSLGLAITPGVIGRLRGAEVSYDASIAVLTATLISIIWYTAFTYESVVHQKSRDEQELLRARMSLATGAIAELRWLEGLLYQVIELGPLSFYDPFGHPVLKAALRQATLFKPKTVGLLADFHSLLRDVQASVNEFRSDPQRVASNKAMYIYFVKAKACYAAGAIPGLVEALREEGGQMPVNEYGEPVWGGQLPALPPSPFGRDRPNVPAATSSGNS